MNPSEKTPENDIVSEMSSGESANNILVLPDGTKPVALGSGIITGILGQGGMAIVYEIWNEQLGVKRAIKLLKPNSSTENKDRFFTEVKLTAQLDHPNIIDIHAVGEWNGHPYIEMEMVDGFSLDTLIRDRGPLPLEISTSIGIFICRALNYTHHHEYVINNQTYIGLLHRDLKPANILISRKGIVRLTDFGIAVPTNVHPHPSGGKVIGSMQYLAPEQLLEDEVNIRADIFSFGCIMYEMLSGEKTFPERNITRLVQKRLRNEFVQLTTFNLAMPPKLIQIVNHCLQQNPLKRPQDIKDVLDELELAHSKLSSKTPEECISFFINGSLAQKGMAFSRSKPPMLYKAAIIGIIIVSVVTLSILSILKFRSSSDIKMNQFAAIDTTTLKTTIKKNTSQRPSPTEEAKLTVQKIASQEQQVALKSKPDTVAVAVPLKPNKAISPISSDIQLDKYTNTSPPAAKPVTRKQDSLPTKAPVNQPSPLVDNEKNKDLKKRFDLETSMRDNAVNTPIELLKKYDSKAQYDSVLVIYSALPRIYLNSIEANLIRHRAMIGKKRETKTYFENKATTINDGEFFYSKAQFYYIQSDFKKSLEALQTAKNTPVHLSNTKEMKRKILLLNAQCNTALYNQNISSEELNKQAMQSWFEVKNEFRDNQDHPFFKEANDQIRLLNKQLKSMAKAP